MNPLLLLVLVVVVIGAGAYFMMRRAQYSALKRRVEGFSEAVQKRSQLDFSPGSPDLRPDDEYCIAFKPFGGSVYRITFYDASGKQETFEDYTQEATDTLITTGKWQMIAQRYSSEENGQTLQFVRRKV